MNNMQRGCAVLLLAAFWTTPLLAVQNEFAPVVSSQLGTTPNVHACGSLYFAGQPTEADVAAIKARGIKRVISLREEDEIDWEEATAIKNAGLDFVAIPFRAPDSLTDKVFDRARGLLRDVDKTPTLLHCGSANRVGAIWLVHRVLDQGVSYETAVEEAKLIGLRTPAYQERAQAYIKRHATPNDPAAH